MYTQEIQKLPTGTALARLTQLLIRAKSHTGEALHMINGRWLDTPQVGLTVKAYVDSMDLTTALAAYGISREFIALLRQRSVVEQLASRMSPVLFGAKSAFEAVSPSGGWVGQNLPIPVRSATLDSVTLPVTKIAAIIVLTNELVQRSGPPAEASISRIMTSALGFVIDHQFLNPSIGAISEVRPASITNGITPTSSTGSTAAAIASDLRAMTAALTTWRDPAWIMQPKTLSHIAARNDGNILQYAGDQPMLLGLPVFTSLGSPQQITLVDLAGIAFADEGQTDIDVSGVASVEMSDTPLAGEQSPITGAVVKSLWQNNLTGLRAIRIISWDRTVDGAVQYMEVSY